VTLYRFILSFLSSARCWRAIEPYWQSIHESRSLYSQPKRGRLNAAAAPKSRFRKCHKLDLLEWQMQEIPFVRCPPLKYITSANSGRRVE
jgi:hypothetical protein